MLQNSVINEMSLFKRRLKKNAHDSTLKTEGRWISTLKSIYEDLQPEKWLS